MQWNLSGFMLWTDMVSFTLSKVFRVCLYLHHFTYWVPIRARRSPLSKVTRKPLNTQKQTGQSCNRSGEPNVYHVHLVKKKHPFWCWIHFKTHGLSVEVIAANTSVFPKTEVCRAKPSKSRQTWSQRLIPGRPAGNSTADCFWATECLCVNALAGSSAQRPHAPKPPGPA